MPTATSITNCEGAAYESAQLLDQTELRVFSTPRVGSTGNNDEIHDGDDTGSEESHFDRGRYGWVIVAASFCGQFLNPLMVGFGLFNIALLDQFEASKGETALVGSICGGFCEGWGIVTGLLANRIGHRLTCMLGGVTAAAGFLISSFAQNLTLLYFSYGILVGIGLSYLNLPCLVMMSFYFKKYRNVATGAASVGAGLGSLFLPIIIQALIEHFSWRGAMVILAGLVLQGCVVGILLKPNPHLKQNTPITKHEHESAFDFSLCREWTMGACMVIFTIWAITSSVYFNMLPHRIILLGFTTDQAAWLLSISGIASVISRIFHGVIFHFIPLHPEIAYGVGQLGMALGTLGFAIDHAHYWLLALASMVYGFAFGLMAFTHSLLFLKIFGLKRLNNAIGYVSTVSGFGGLAGAPLAGLLFDHIGNYRVSLFAATSLSIFGSAVCFPIHVHLRRRKRGGEKTVTE